LFIKLLGFSHKSILAGDLNEKYLVTNSIVSSPLGLNLLELFVHSYFEIPAFGGWRGISSFHLRISRLQPCQEQDAKGKVTESTQDHIGKGFLFQPHHSWTVFRTGAA
jgi:hypothetical protein